MRFQVEFTEAASEQVQLVAAWWRANRRAAPDLFESELTDAVAQLAAMPPLAQVWGEVEGQPVRKLRLPRTRLAIFFTIESGIVVVRALWHGVRGSGPPL